MSAIIASGINTILVTVVTNKTTPIGTPVIVTNAVNAIIIISWGNTKSITVEDGANAAVIIFVSHTTYIAFCHSKSIIEDKIIIQHGESIITTVSKDTTIITSITKGCDPKFPRDAATNTISTVLSRGEFPTNSATIMKTFISMHRSLRGLNATNSTTLYCYIYKSALLTKFHAAILSKWSRFVALPFSLSEPLQPQLLSLHSKNSMFFILKLLLFLLCWCLPWAILALYDVTFISFLKPLYLTTYIGENP